MDKTEIGSLCSLRRNALLGLHRVKGSRTVSGRTAVSALYCALETPPDWSPSADFFATRNHYALIHTPK